MIFAVKAALEGRAGGSAADGRPVVAGQVNITRQRTVDGIAPAVDLRRKPSQLRCGTNLIHAVGQSGLRLGGAVPCAGSRGRQRNDLGQHTAGHISLVCAAQVEAAVDIVAAGAEHRIGVSAVGQVLILAVAVGGMDIACGIRQRHSGRGGGGIGNIQLQLEVIARSDLHIHIGETVQAEVHRDRVEVRAHAGIRHFVQGGERIRRRVHGAVGITVGELNIGGAAGAKVHIRRDCQLQLSLIHLLILGDIGLIGRIADGIEQVVGSGVENATVFVNAPVAAIEGKRHLIAGHNLRLLGIGGVGDRGGHFGHTSQTVGGAGAIMHLDDHSTASQPSFAEAQETCVILAAGIRRQGGPAGKIAHHSVLVRGDNGVLNRRCAAAGHREVQSGSGVVTQIEPVVVVIIPRRRARRTQAVGIIGDIGFCIAVFGRIIGKHEHTGARGIGGRVEAAVGAVLVSGRIDIQRLIVHGNDSCAIGCDIQPVALGIAAVRYIDRALLAQHFDLELGLDHDVHGIAVNDLPQTVGADTLRSLFRVLIAGGIQIRLDLGLVTGLGNGAKVVELVIVLIRAISTVEGEGLGEVGRIALEPTGLGDIVRHTRAIVLQTPGVVGIALADFVGQSLCAGSSVSFSLSSRIDGLRVEVIILEVERKICVVGNRRSHRYRLGERQILGNYRVPRSSRIIDRLREDEAVSGCCGRLHIGVPKSRVAGSVHHEGIVGVVAGRIGCSVLHITAHNGHGHTSRIVLSGKVVGAVLFARGIDGVQAQINIRAAAGAAVHIGLSGQGQAVAAQVNICAGFRSFVAIGAEGISAGSQAGIEIVVVICQRAGRIGRSRGKITGLKGQRAVTFQIVGIITNGKLIFAINLGDGQASVLIDVLGLATNFIGSKVVSTLIVKTSRLVELDQRVPAAIGGIVHIPTDMEGIVLLDRVVYGQCQRPGVRGQTGRVHGMELIDICTGGVLRDLDRGSTEQSRGEVVRTFLFASSDRSIVIVVGVAQGRTVRILKDVASLQIGQVIGVSYRHGRACGDRNTALQPRDLCALRSGQNNGVGSRAAVVGSGKHDRILTSRSGSVAQGRAVQRLCNAVDGCCIGQRIAIDIREHLSHIQRPGIAQGHIGCGDRTGSDRGGRLAFIGEGEEVDRRIAGAAVILRRIGSSATICTQHKALLDRGPILGGTGVVQGNCDCDIPIALRIGHFYTAASPLRHIGVVAGCYTVCGIGQYGSVFVCGLYIGRACGNGDQIIGHILESRVAGKGHRVLHTDSCRSCGLVIRTIGNNTIQRRSYCALFRCKDCRGKDGQNHHERKQH